MSLSAQAPSPSISNQVFAAGDPNSIVSPIPNASPPIPHVSPAPSPVPHPSREPISIRISGSLPASHPAASQDRQHSPDPHAEKSGIDELAGPFSLKRTQSMNFPCSPNPLAAYPSWIFEVDDPLAFLTVIQIYQANLTGASTFSDPAASDAAPHIRHHWKIDADDVVYFSFLALPAVLARAKVTSLCLDFSRQGLEDTFTPELLSAAFAHARGHLTELVVRDSIFFSSLDPFVPSAKRISLLDLSECTQIAPISLARLIKACGASLRYLTLKDVGTVDDKTAKSISKYASKIRHLDLSNCRKISPSCFCHLLSALTRLTKLNLSSTQITSSGLRRAKFLPLLTKLVLMRCALLDSSGIITIAAGISPGVLTKLKLSGIKASDRSYILLARSTAALRTLILQDLASISDNTIRDFVNRNPGLVILDLRACPAISRRVLADISRCSMQLEELSFDGISGTLSSMPNDKSITPIASLTRLKALRLSHCPLITDFSVKQAATTSPLLETLVLDHCIKITNASLVSIAKHCTLLQDLSLKGAKNVSHHAIEEFAKKCTLRRVDLSDNQLARDEGLISIALAAPLFLTKLDVANCVHVTDKSLVSIGKGCFSLERLNLSGCRAITDQGVLCLVPLSRLEELMVALCWRLTSASLVPLINALRSLHHFNLSGTAVSDDALHALGGSRLAHSLRSLNLSFCDRLTNATAREHLPRMNVTALSLPPRMEGPTLAAITAAQQLLTQLHIDESEIDDATLEQLAGQLSQLRVLTLRNCPNLIEGMTAVAVHCALLVSLDLTGSAHVSSGALIDVINRCPNLRQLRLLGCRAIRAQAIDTTIKHCRLLSLLEIGGPHCVHLTSDLLLNASSTSLPSHAEEPHSPFLRVSGSKLHGSSMAEIPKDPRSSGSSGMPSLMMEHRNLSSPDLKKGAVKIFSKNLYSLTLRYADLSPAAYRAIFVRCPNLNLLDLSFSAVTDKCLKRIAKYCRALRVARFVGSPFITGPGLLYLCDKLKIISEIDISLCDRIHFDIIDILKEKHPSTNLIYSARYASLESSDSFDS